MPFAVDIEPTNRCNAHCEFCPRDATPYQGLMSPEIFEHSLARCIELRSQLRSLGRPGEFGISFCGLGEPLVNQQTPMFVRHACDAGFECAMSSNGALLDERRARALIDAGLQRMTFNVGELDDAYEKVYRLPFERTHDNILRFKQLAGDTCQVSIVLVDHRHDRAHVNAMKDYWRDRAIDAFMELELINRGGALFVEHMQYETYPEVAEAQRLLEEAGVKPLCVAPFVYLFVGYDGQYYLCFSDWRKQVPLGSVFDVSFADVMLAKLAHVTHREPVCKSCNYDPVNIVADALRAEMTGMSDTPDIRDVIEKVRAKTDFSLAEIETLTGQKPSLDTIAQPRTLRRIPVTAV